MKLKAAGKQKITWNGPLVVSAIALLAAVVITISTIPSIFSAAMSPLEGENADTVLDDLLLVHEVTAKTGYDRFLGRSPFFVPRRPPSRPIQAPPPRSTPQETPPPVAVTPPGPPATYQGPKPTSLLGQAVFFRSNEKWISVGSEDGGVSVISIKDPWTVVLGHSGGEYDVALWGDRKSEFFTVPYNGGARSNGFVSQPTDNAPLARSVPPPPTQSSPPSEQSSTSALPDNIDQSTINGMSIREAADAMKSIHVLLRAENLGVERQEVLTDTLERLRARLRGGS